MFPGDQDCVERCLGRDPEGFRQLVQRYQGALSGYLVGQVGDPEQAEEVAQEAFVRAYFSLDKLRKPQSFLPWLLGIAARVVKEQHRAEQRRREAARLAPERSPSPSVSHNCDLERALAELPDSYRDVILLRYYAGLSCSQVAEQLALPLGTVTKKLSRAYAMLRETLRRYEKQPECSEVKP